MTLSASMTNRSLQQLDKPQLAPFFQKKVQESIHDSCTFFLQPAGGPAAFFAGSAVAFHVEVVGMAFRAFRKRCCLFHVRCLLFFFLFGRIYAKDIAPAAAVPEYGNPFASLFPGRHVNVVDIIHRGLIFKVHGTGNGIVHVFLHGRLHVHPIHEGDFMAFHHPGEPGPDFLIRQSKGQVMVFQEVLHAVGENPEMAMDRFHFVGGALVGNLVERFAAAGEAAHEERDSAGGSNGQKGTVPKAMLVDVLIKFGI